ncbi:MAG: bestrophin family protein [Cyclobacteriaceae bacterium]|nr:bestrophin family protein [Cyclobacteriaceae bacterium]
MINYDPRTWLTAIVHAYSRSVMRTLLPVLIFMTIYTAILCYVLLVLRFHERDFKTTISMHSLLGIVLGLFLVFRTNTAYERWWEGRRMWGSLVNNTRNFALKLNAFLESGDLETRQWFAKMIPYFVVAVKEHLRKGVNPSYWADIDPALYSDLEGVSHIPNRLSSLIYQRVNSLYKKNVITGDQLLLLDREMKEFSEILGACERIKNTPIPYSYKMYFKQFIFIYVITLPFAFVTTSGFLTIPIVLIITFVLLSIELIAEEIEDPFGKDMNDLPTDELSAKIRENVTEILDIKA